MFKKCLGLSSTNVESDQIVKSSAFVYTNKSKPKIKYVTSICNDYELLNLQYLGFIESDLNGLKSLFGEPQRLCCYKGPFSFEIVWYIKFNDGTICSISKYFKNEYRYKFCEKWRVCANNTKAIKHIIHLFV